jgi:hypothetical protein
LPKTQRQIIGGGVATISTEMKKFVSLRLNQKSVLDKIAMGKTIELNMTGNANFTTPFPTLITLHDVVKACDDAETLALNGGKQQKSDLDDAEALLDATLTQIGKYVDSIANGNGTIILSAGLDTQSERETANVPDAPLLKSVANNNVPLSLKATWDTVKFVRAYVVEQNDDEALPENGWKQISIQTKRSIIVTGLISGKKYAFRVKAIGIMGEGMYSNVVVCRVL